MTVCEKTIITTSSNRAKILALHETNREYVLLRSIIQHERQTCGLSSRKVKSTIIHEDNSTYISQLKE